MNKKKNHSLKRNTLFRIINMNICKRISIYQENRFLSNIYDKYIQNNDRVSRILRLKNTNIPEYLLGERDLPGDEKFQKNGWWKKMLLRYGLAMHFSKGKDVLETCSGVGWGSYLLDDLAKSVTCIEIDYETIILSKKLWELNNTEYICGSVLNIPIQDNKYDVITAMESIEHFELSDIKKYLEEIYRTLKPNGLLIGSSSFPETRENADALCSKNEYHLHICTRDEIIELLKTTGFKNIKIFYNNLYFIARK